jgi:hypothetical protein
MDVSAVHVGGRFDSGGEATCVVHRCASIRIGQQSPPDQQSDFSSSDSSLGVLDSINVYKTAAATKADFDSLLNAKTPGCTQSYLNSVSGHAALDKASGGGIGKLTVTRAMGLPSGVGGLDIRFLVSEQSTTTHVELIFAVFIKGDLEENLGFTAINTTFPNALERQLTALAIARL